MNPEPIYRIEVKTLRGNLITFKGVRSYESKEGFLHFTDEKLKIDKIFPVANCEINIENGNTKSP